MSFLDTLIAVLGITSWTLMLEGLVLRKRVEVLREVRRIDNAAVSLARHSQALSQLLKVKELDESLRKFALTFSELVLDRRYANQAIDDMLNSTAYPYDPDVERHRELIDQLRREEPKTAERYDEVMRFGTLAMMLQWPETNAKFAEFMVKTAADDDTSRAARVIAVSKQAPSRPSNLGLPPDAIPAH